MSFADILGTYQCKGFDPGGNANYTNPISITKSGDVFNFQWLNTNGQPFNLGTGILNPNQNNVLSVVFWDMKKPEYFGTMLYNIKEDGSLQGYWVIQSTVKIGTENCVKDK
jgi:hypothetical protein